jgi:hypothetical protein
MPFFVLKLIMNDIIIFFTVSIFRQLMDNQIHTIESGTFDDLKSVERM